MTLSVSQREQRRRARIRRRRRLPSLSWLVGLGLLTAAATAVGEIANHVDHAGTGANLVFACSTYGVAGAVLALMLLSPRLLARFGVLLYVLIALVMFAPLFGSFELVFAVAALLHNPPDRRDAMLGLVLWGLIGIPSLALVAHAMLRRRQAEARERLTETYLELQGLELTRRGDLNAVNPRPGDVPQCVVVEESGRYMRFYRDDLPIGVRQQMVALPDGVAFQVEAAVRYILDQDIPCTRVVHRRVYTFPGNIAFARNDAIVRLKPKYKLLLAQLGFTAASVQQRPTFVALHAGEGVSYCRAAEFSNSLSHLQRNAKSLPSLTTAGAVTRGK
jgi:hypothetical protein